MFLSGKAYRESPLAYKPCRCVNGRRLNRRIQIGSRGGEPSGPAAAQAVRTGRQAMP
jgi:hypothetical protein